MGIYIHVYIYSYRYAYVRHTAGSIGLDSPIHTRRIDRLGDRSIDAADSLGIWEP